MNRILLFLLPLVALSGCGSSGDRSPITIDIWYGDHQEFGQLGMPQQWINILGNVQSENGIKNFTYQLNNAEPKALTLGSDLHRLAAFGDFNVDLKVNDCEEGENRLKLIALDSGEQSLIKEIILSVKKNNQWPLPYSINWAEVEKLQDVLQVVDGHWKITKDGLHNLDTYYDRAVAFGDTSWTNYEVSTTVTFHHFTPPEKGPPTYHVSHAAIASRWPGHCKDELQPCRQWYPLGATSELRLTEGLDSCRWRIFDGPKPESIGFYVEQEVEAYRTIELNKVYGMKHRVETIGIDSTRYSVKLWPRDHEEPKDWDFSGIELDENLAAGSALLLAHNTGVTFGDVEVIAIE
jgi:hypothetical protein